ncbi:MAG: hypothetical protein IJS14_12125 [Lentisphaeria bacterium]|nr:hypothetical protein [Lentisphaeria bacterium]
MNNAYKIRTAIVFVILLVWAGGAAFRVYALSVRDRDELLRQARTLAWREAVIPARRGRILDRDGVALARDVYCCDLVLDTLPDSPQRKVRLFAALHREFPNCPAKIDEKALPYCLKSSLTAEEIRRYSELFHAFREIRVEGTFERWRDPHPAVRRLVGEIVLNDRKERVGGSGLEQNNDLTLSGKPGQIRVMLDRHGNWVRDTLRVIRQPRNGEDLRLDVSRAEIIRQEEGTGHGI